MYTCTCIDACTNTTVCKHMHLIKMQQPTNETIKNHENKQNHFKHYIKVMNILTTKPSTVILKQKIHKRLHELVISCNNVDNGETLQKIYESLSTALGHVYNESNNPAVGMKRKPSHKNSLTQQHYQSTRKKRKVECKTFNKPASEPSICQENLFKDEEICGICFRQDDHDTQESINWICCN